MLIEPGRVYVEAYRSDIRFGEYATSSGDLSTGDLWTDRYQEIKDDKAWMVKNDWIAVPVSPVEFPYPEDIYEDEDARYASFSSLVSVNISNLTQHQLRYLTSGMGFSLAHPKVLVDVLVGPDGGESAHRVHVGKDHFLSNIGLLAKDIPAKYSYTIGLIVARMDARNSWYIPTPEKSLEYVNAGGYRYELATVESMAQVVQRIAEAKRKYMDEYAREKARMEAHKSRASGGTTYGSFTTSTAWTTSTSSTTGFRIIRSG